MFLASPVRWGGLEGPAALRCVSGEAVGCGWEEGGHMRNSRSSSCSQCINVLHGSLGHVSVSVILKTECLYKQTLLTSL